jgi:hypothetical protein
VCVRGGGAARVECTTAAAGNIQVHASLSHTGLSVDTQNLRGNDCAKARVSLCVKSDPLCLPFQGVIEETGSGGSGAAAQEVSSALAASCPVAEPTQPGVKVCAYLRASMPLDSHACPLPPPPMLTA